MMASVALAVTMNEVTLDHGMHIIRDEHEVAYEGSIPVNIKINIPRLEPHIAIDRLNAQHNCHRNTGLTVCKYLDLLRPMYNNAFDIVRNNFANLFPAGPPVNFQPKEEEKTAIRVT